MPARELNKQTQTVVLGSLAHIGIIPAGFVETGNNGTLRRLIIGRQIDAVNGIPFYIFHTSIEYCTQAFIGWIIYAS